MKPRLENIRGLFGRHVGQRFGRMGQSVGQRYTQPLVQRLLQLIAPYRARFDALQPRERMLVGTAGVFIALAVVYAGIWQPFAKARVRNAADLDSARSVATTLGIAQAEMQARQQHGGGQVVGSDVSLLTAVDQASKNGTLSKPPSRLQPDGDNQARVWVEDVQFDSLIRWMYELQNRYGLKIDVADIERQPTSGLVNARLSLTRPQ